MPDQDTSLKQLIGNQLEVRKDGTRRVGEIASIAIVGRTLRVRFRWFVERRGASWVHLGDLRLSIPLVKSAGKEADEICVDVYRINSTELGSFHLWRNNGLIPPEKNAQPVLA